MTTAFQSKKLALVNITLQECIVICAHPHFTISQLASHVIAKERVLRQMYATKKQETVSVSKVSPDQIVVSAPLVFTITPSVLGVHAVLLVPLKMFVTQRQGSATVKTGMKEILVMFAKTDTTDFLSVRLVNAHHLEVRTTVVIREVESVLASRTTAETTVNNVQLIITVIQNASSANVTQTAAQVKDATQSPDSVFVKKMSAAEAAMNV